MLKKMRLRFVVAAMAAFATVVLALLCAVNLWNYRITTSILDDTLERLQGAGQEGAPPFRPGSFELPGPPGGFSPEMQYMTRFFAVRFDDAGHAAVEQEYIASVTAPEAAAYGAAVLRRGGASGYYRDYRYLAVRTGESAVVVFLNAERELQSMRSLLLVSGMAAAASLLAVFLLVLLFSRRAIAPYVRNIETQKRFITDASHELKTPLTSIAASADVLAMENGDDEWVQNIRAQSARLSRLVGNLVTLSRLDEEQPFPEMTDFSLSDAVWEIAESAAAMAKAKGRTYEQHIEDGLTVHGDRAAVQQMVSILLDNALKYSDEGGRVRLSVEKRQKKARITVCNTCAPVDVEHIDRLFDRFYRPDNSRARQAGGTGIGLSIARATAEHHGGRIAVSSQDGHGITFTVQI